ncbi:OmpA family protein [Massilia sp. YMA4]|uniref:OmpA family protein n=1 Tax=Massilia sp. YMA4 TaxID=1593482 RepID=UPI000DD152EE|nr:hypothetical protein DPH57_09325 [Massilia sp. YMA4]
MNPLLTAILVIAPLAQLGGCSLNRLRTDDSPAPPRPVRDDYSIVQTGFGSSARFAICRKPTCPLPTTKRSIVAAASSQSGLPWQTHSRVDWALTYPPEPAPPAHLSLYYRPGDTQLDEARQRSIDAFLTGKPAARVNVVARTDASGSARVNQHIAQLRAARVATYLRERAIVPLASVAIDTAVLCCQRTGKTGPSERSRDRRVDIQLTFPSASPSP